MIGNMAEWLRRQTRNLVGIALVGSNPAVVEYIFFNYVYLFLKKKIDVTLAHDQKVTAIALRWQQSRQNSSAPSVEG